MCRCPCVPGDSAGLASRFATSANASHRGGELHRVSDVNYLRLRWFGGLRAEGNPLLGCRHHLHAATLTYLQEWKTLSLASFTFSTTLSSLQPSTPWVLSVRQVPATIGNAAVYTVPQASVASKCVGSLPAHHLAAVRGYPHQKSMACN